MDEKHRIVQDNLIVREDGEVLTTIAEKVTYMDIAPNQMISVAASLVPFLENDDANRALMGSNMQRQAVPLMVTSAPLSGPEWSDMLPGIPGPVFEAGDGVVEEADSNRIVVRYDQPGTDGYDTGVAVYRLEKYKKSNQNTCFTQRPIVLAGHQGEERVRCLPTVLPASMGNWLSAKMSPLPSCLGVDSTSKIQS